MEKSKYFKVLVNNMKNNHLDENLSYLNNPNIQIIEYLAQKNSHIHYAQIQKNTGLESSKLQQNLDYLLKKGILKNGIQDMFFLNFDNSCIQKLFQEKFLKSSENLYQQFSNKKINASTAFNKVEELSDKLDEIIETNNLTKEDYSIEKDNFWFWLQEEVTDIYSELRMANHLEREHKYNI